MHPQDLRVPGVRAAHKKAAIPICGRVVFLVGKIMVSSSKNGDKLPGGGQICDANGEAMPQALPAQAVVYGLFTNKFYEPWQYIYCFKTTASPTLFHHLS